MLTVIVTRAFNCVLTSEELLLAVLLFYLAVGTRSLLMRLFWYMKCWGLSTFLK